MAQHFDASGAPFDRLNPEERAAAERALDIAYFRPNETILGRGAAPESLFIVMKGSIRISKQSASGEEALAVLEPPAFFGEMALIDHSTRAADAIANEDTDLFFIPLQELRSVIDAYHKIALKILYALCEVLAQRLRETNERYMSIFTIAQWGGSNPEGHLPVP